MPDRRRRKVAPPSSGKKATPVVRAADRNVRRSPATSEAIYTDEERVFLAAVERYKRLRGRSFPTFCEILAIVKSLGYRCVDAPGPLPSWPLIVQP